MAERVELEPGFLVSWDKYLGWYWRCSCEPVAHRYDDNSLCALDAAAHYEAAHRDGVEAGRTDES